MAERPVATAVVGTTATTVVIVDLLRAVTGVVLLIGELPKEEQVRVEAVLNYCLHALNTQKDELATAKLFFAEIEYLRGSRTAQEESVRLENAGSKRD